MYEYIETLKKAFDDAAFPRGLLPLRARAIGSCYLRWGLYCFTAGKVELGTSSVAEAFLQDPSLRTDKNLIRETLAYHIVNVLPSRSQMDEHSVGGVEEWLEMVYTHWASDARGVLAARRELLA